MKLVIVKNPFKTDKEVKDIDYIPGQKIYSYVQPEFMGHEVVISHNGEIVPGEEYNTLIPDPDDYIAVCPVIYGGGGGGKDLGRTLATLALTIVTMGVGSMAAGGAFWGANAIGAANWGFWSWVAAAGTYAAGGYLINQMFPAGQSQNVEQEQTYGWSQLSPITKEGNAIPITFGTVKMGVMAPIQMLTRHVTSDGKKQFLNLLLSGGEGPIDSITDLKINDNPYTNYDGVEYETRLGTNDQSVISNFNDTYFPQSVSYELEEGASPSVSQLNGDYQGIEVVLNFPAGLYKTDTSDGDIKSTSVTVELKYRLVGDATWTAWDTKTISGKYTHAIRRVYSKHDLPEGQYEVSVQCTNKSSTDDNYINDVYWTTLSGIVYDDFTYPNKVLVGIQALATDQLSGGMPKIQWTQTRSNIWVWNPSTGSYEQKPADNPAWACYDIIHRCRYLKNINTGSKEYVVQGVPASRIDYQAFENWASFCMDKGITYNGVISQTKTLWEALKEPEQAGRGKVLMRGTRFSCVCDAPSNPVQLFTISNMEMDSFKEEFMGTQERANALELTFYNIDNNYEKTTVPIYGSDYDQETVIQNPTQVNLDFAMTLDQAYKYGAYQLRVNQHINRTISWSADIDAIACQVGDVVLVQHDVPRWGTGGRIVSATVDTITLDKEVTLESGVNYAVMIRLEDDTLIEKTVQGVSSETTTDVLTVTEPFATIPQQHDVFSFGEVEKVAKPARLISISREEDFRYKLQGIEYIEEIYTEATDIPVVDYTQDTGEISDVSVVQFVENYNAKIGISWDPPEMFYSARIIIDSQQVGRVGAYESSFEYSVNHIPEGTEISIRIYALDELGNIIDSSTVYWTVEAKTTAPQNVSWGECSFAERVILRWHEVANYDLGGYEVRIDENFGSEDTNLIYKGDETSYVIDPPTQRNYNLYIKAYNRSGVYSANASTITVSKSAPDAPAFTSDHITEFFEAVKIHVPYVSGATGYNVYITPSDGSGNATGTTEVVPLSSPQTITYNLDSGESILIKIGSIDRLTELMDDENISSEIEATAANIHEIAQFAANLRPPQIVDSLPGLPDSDFPEGSQISYDGKLYVSKNNNWVSKVEEATTAVNALEAATVEAGAIGTDEIASNAITTNHIGTNEIITVAANIGDATITSAKIIDIQADKLTIGGGTTYESGYDPSSKETPSGAQSKADSAENNAKNYADTEINNAKDFFQKSSWKYEGDWNINETGEGYNFIFNAIPDKYQDYMELKVLQNDLEQHVDILLNSTKIVDGIGGANSTTEWKVYQLNSSDLNNTSDNTIRIEHDGADADWGHIYQVELAFDSQAYTEGWCEEGADVTSDNNNWSDVNDDNGSKPADNADVTGNNHSKDQHDFDAYEGSADGGNLKLGTNLGENNDKAGMVATDGDGNYSVISSSHLAFYEYGSTIPHWYSRRVAYGVDVSGTKITLNWDKKPKVVACIASLESYNATYSSDDQGYDVTVSGISAESFYVYGNNIVEGTQVPEISNSIDMGTTTQYTSSYGDATDVTKMEIEWKVQGDMNEDYHYDHDYDMKVEYQKLGGSWITHNDDTFTQYDTNFIKTFVSVIDNLTPGEYKFRITITPRKWGEWSIEHWYQWGNVIVNEGEIMWIAIEGGAPE